MNNLSVVIPALNEPYLNILVDKISYELEKCISIDEWEIIIRTDKGCGNAICKGIEESQYDIVCVMDGDGSHNPRYIPKMFFHLNKGDSVISYGYKKETSDSYFRQSITFVFDKIARTLVHPLPDLMSGFFMFNKSKLSYPSKLEHPKVLMKILMFNQDFNIMPIPIVFERRKEGKSKLGNWKVAYLILKDMILNAF